MFLLPKELMDKVELHQSKFSNIYKSCLKVKKEKIIIISDHGMEGHQLSSTLALGYYQAAKKKGYDIELIFQELKKGFMQADPQVISAVDSLEPGNIIILCLSNKLGRMGAIKSFRSFCKERGHRFISATGLADAKDNHLDLFLEAMDLNYSRLAKKGLAIKKIWDAATEIRIKTEAGTDLTFNVSGMTALTNIGDYNLPGSGGNMPAGEIYIAPKGYYNVKGIVVVDGSVKTDEGALLLDEPVKLYIEEGKIVRMEGQAAELLERTFKKYEDRAKYPYRIRHISELGLGINPGAVLVGSTILDEKVLGTAHIGIGSNYWFGGDIKTIFHGDYIFKSPQIYVDGKKMEL
ncbi:MAG TPA: aminopeptidase [Candidatus Nanoarchaeia archaeon]|nr:aminopeptidase [Candidatus Nanoarchaeia archaeon]